MAYSVGKVLVPSSRVRKNGGKHDFPDGSNAFRWRFMPTIHRYRNRETGSTNSCQNLHPLERGGCRINMYIMHDLTFRHLCANIYCSKWPDVWSLWAVNVRTQVSKCQVMHYIHIYSTPPSFERVQILAWIRGSSLSIPVSMDGWHEPPSKSVGTIWKVVLTTIFPDTTRWNQYLSNRVSHLRYTPS